MSEHLSTSMRLLVSLVGIVLAGCAMSGSPTTTPADIGATTVPSQAPTPAATAAPAATPADLGTTWSTVIDAPRAEAVSAGGPGWVAVGRDAPIGDPESEYQVAAAWTSTDGRAWTRSPDVAMPAGSVSGEMTAVISTATGLMAAGTVDLTNGTVWRSLDGVTWDVIGWGPILDLGPCIEGCGGLTSMAVGPAGIVVAGSRVLPAGSSEANLWSSTDAMGWERTLAPTDADGGSAAVSSVAAGDRGFVATGTVL